MTAQVLASRRSNNLDALRLLAALAVIVGHGCVLIGRSDLVPSPFGIGLQGLGVNVFFSISGYLIVGSWERSRSLRAYFSSRILRIFPALIVVVLLSVFVLGPMLTTVSLAEYFRSGQTYFYLRNLLLLPVAELPGVFTSNPFPNAVNGSLWTLGAEFACYLVVPLIGFLPRVLRIPGWVAFGIASVVLSSVHIEIFDARVESGAFMWVFFAVGAILRLGLRREAFRLDVAAFVVVLWLGLLGFFPEWSALFAWLALPYCVLALGLQSTPVARQASRFGDFSYGLYLWAFPVQQAVVQLLGVLPLGWNLLIVIAITLALAVGSWYLVERPSISLARRMSQSRPDPDQTVPAGAAMIAHGTGDVA
ncbi:acyltransferase [soil metagenome]